MINPDTPRMKSDLARLVSFKTENPPGEEIEAAQFLADLFDNDGFATEIDQYRPGDAKGPLIAVVEAMRLLKAQRGAWRGTLLGVFVGDEEDRWRQDSMASVRQIAARCRS